MDQDIIKIEKVVVSGEMPPTPAEEALEEPYIPLLKPDTPAASIIQPYQHENLQCFQCFITFCNSKAKERHMKKSHREEYKQQLQQCDTLFTCYVCDRTFLSSEELTQHQGSHNKEDKPFKCSHCQESFRTFSELTSHRRQVCPERQFICRDCGETFRGPALLRSHRLAQHPPRHEDMSVTDETKTHRCGKCGRGFEAETELLQHQENHAGDQHCNGSTPTKRRGRPPKAECVMHGKGKRVKKDESGLKLSDAQLPFVGKGDVVGFPGQAQKVSMAEQDEVDGKEETSAAPPASLHPCKDCKLSFSTGAQLRAHKKEKHSRSLARKPFACGECEESFPRPEQLESHVARAHSAGRYCCPQCGKSFGRESNLKAHRLVHSEERKVKDGCNR